MSTTRKIAIGLGIAGSALLATWLLTGDRKQKTRKFIAKKTKDLKSSLTDLKSDNDVPEDEVYYI